MENITPHQLKAWVEQGVNFQLIDTREPFEHEDFNIGGLLLPLGDIAKNIAQIDTSRPVVIYCRKGIRSQIAIQRLQTQFPFTNLINLQGGTEAWKAAFDIED